MGSTIALSGGKGLRKMHRRGGKSCNVTVGGRKSAHRSMRKGRKSARRSMHKGGKSARRSMRKGRKSARRSMRKGRKSARRSMRKGRKSARRSMRKGRKSARRSMRRGSRGRKGAGMVARAALPFGILALQKLMHNRKSRNSLKRMGRRVISTPYKVTKALL